MSYILADGWLITMNAKREVMESASLCVVGYRIAAIGTRTQMLERYPEAEVIDCAGKIMMPRMLNTHTHLFQTLLKGLGDDMVLKKWFTFMTGPSAIHLMSDDAHAAAMHGCVESIRGGVTTVLDFMYAHPKPGMIAAVVGAFEETGVRGFVCRGFASMGEEYGTPRELIETPEKALGDAREQIRRFNKPGGRVQVGVACNMIWTVDEEVYRTTRELADEEKVLVTTHIGETVFQLETSAAKYGKIDTEFLSDIGFLGPDVVAAHCVHCTEANIRLLLKHDVKVSNNRCSNQYLASECAPIPEMLKAGLTVGATCGPLCLGSFFVIVSAGARRLENHFDPVRIANDKIPRARPAVSVTMNRSHTIPGMCLGIRLGDVACRSPVIRSLSARSRMFEFAKTIQSAAEAGPVGPIRLVGTAPEDSPVKAAPRLATKSTEGNSVAINRLSWFAKVWSRRAWNATSLVRLVVAFALLTVCSWLGIILSHQSGGVATIWLTNGMLFGLVITQPRSRWPAYFVAGLMADTIADVLYGDSFRLAIGVSLANSVEVILSCLLLTRLFGYPFNLSRRQPLLGFLVVSVVGAAALTSAMGASWTLLWVDAGPWLQLFRAWYLGDLLGMALIAPLTFMLQREDFLSILHPNSLAHTLLILMVPAVTTVLVFSHKEDPLVFLLFPALLLVVFRLGFPGTVINIFLIALLSIGLTVKGYGPLMMIVGEHAILHRIVVAQIFLAVAIFTMFPVAALLEERASLQLCLQASEARCRNLASIDDLTGLFNRRAFNVRLEQEWTNALGVNEPIALLLVDADLFKKYNDHFGHLAGDQCLQRVAGAIAESVSRPSSFVARFGGEEFAIILPRTGLDAARQIAESIRLAVVDMRMPHPATLSGVQSVSIGVAMSVLGSDRSAPDLIGRADLALYRAKDRGRNQVVFA